ncbi:Amino-transferase class IV [Fragilaria crotonensis]|nr:Amino-transferase class IV [Fragilaria crotonensis]
MTASPSSTPSTIVVVHCWSAPRSRSTALLYSFESRENCIALDEPLYREWLIARKGRVERPYLAAMLSGVCVNDEDHDVHPDKWLREQLVFEDRLNQAIEKLQEKKTGENPKVIFCKHMAKHDCVYDFTKYQDTKMTNIIHRHVLLIRDPVAVLSSWNQSGDVHGNTPAIDEVGILPLMTIYSHVVAGSHLPSNIPVILNSDDLVENPAGTLERLCFELHVDYQQAMLTWKDGPHECDGPWAKLWYESVWKSTGWQPRAYMDTLSKYEFLHPSLLPALRASLPAYDFLHRQSHSYKTRGPPGEEIYEDARNENVLVWIGTPGRGRLVPRELASISPWDSSVQGGDAAWEGLRVYNGKILHLDKHLQRLVRSAKALGFYETGQVHSTEEITEAITRTLAANGMRDGAHMRLTLTRGEKYTSSMNPKFNVYGTTLIVLAEWKPTEGKTTYDNSKGITLITASQRRNPPQTVDSKIHHNNLINNILPKIQANYAGAADAIMLDVEGYVSETNATNIFMVDDDGILLTPHADHCLPGITRATVLELAADLNIACLERRVSLAEFHAAAEVFTTGTMGELTPVTSIDGRTIGTGIPGPVTLRLQAAYKELPDKYGYPLPEFCGV